MCSFLLDQSFCSSLGDSGVCPLSKKVLILRIVTQHVVCCQPEVPPATSHRV